jgi:hypothetical protein
MFAADNLILYDMGARRVVGLAIEPMCIGSRLDLERYSFVRNCMTNQLGAADFGLLKSIIRRGFLPSTSLPRSDSREDAPGRGTIATCCE